MTVARRSGPFLVRALRSCDREIDKALPRVLRAKDDEAVHALRVGIRRMRVLLKLARPVFGRFYADAVRAQYTIVHQSTGALRDAEVLEDTVTALGLSGPSFALWLTRRRAVEAQLRRGVVRDLVAGQLSGASALLRALLLLPIAPANDVALVRFAAKSVARAQARVTKLAGAPPHDVVALHALRIAYKGLRYATEILAAALSPELVTLGAPAAKFQKRLGEIHDLDVARVVTARARSLTPAARTHALALLLAARNAAVAKYLAEPPLPIVRRARPPVA